MNSQAVQYADASLDMLVLDSYFEPPNLYGHKRIHNSFNEIFSIKLDQITLCFLFLAECNPNWLRSDFAKSVLG